MICFLFVFALFTIRTKSLVQSPNVLLIYLDDAGFGDLSTNEGSKLSPSVTPHLAKLSEESLRLTDFHAAASVCTPSRASILTGRYALRYGLHLVIGLKSRNGLPQTENTIAKLLKRSAGYINLMVGKWHLGSEPPFDPSSHGFDHVLHIPFSHDLACYQRWPCTYTQSDFFPAAFSKELYDMCLRGAQPTAAPPNDKRKPYLAHEACPSQSLKACDPKDPARLALEQNCGHGCGQALTHYLESAQRAGLSAIPPINSKHILSLPLLWSDNAQQKANFSNYVLEQPTSPWELPDKMFNFFQNFLAQHNNEKPYFAFVNPTGPHLPYLPHPKFQKSGSTYSKNGPIPVFLDTMTEIDDFIGRVTKLAGPSVFTIITSDNGPYAPVANVWRTGSLGPYTAGGKYSPWEGGHRVFGLFRWPNFIRPGVSDRLCSQLDILPTLLRLVNPELSMPKNLDGTDLGPWLFRQDERAYLFNSTDISRHRVLLIPSGTSMIAARVGRYKIWLQRTQHTKQFSVYDIQHDPGERRPLSGPASLLSAVKAKVNVALTAFHASKAMDKAIPKSTSRHASFCCEPRLYDCHCRRNAPFLSPVPLLKHDSSIDDRCSSTFSTNTTSEVEEEEVAIRSDEIAVAYKGDENDNKKVPLYQHLDQRQKQTALPKQKKKKQRAGFGFHHSTTARTYITNKAAQK